MRHHPPRLDLLPVPVQLDRPSSAGPALGLRQRWPAGLGADHRPMGRPDRRAAVGRPARAGKAMGSTPAHALIALGEGAQLQTLLSKEACMRRRQLLALSAGALAAPALVTQPARAAVETRELHG